MWRLLLGVVLSGALLLGFVVGVAGSATSTLPAVLAASAQPGECPYNSNVTYQLLTTSDGESVLRLAGTSHDTCVPEYSRYTLNEGVITAYFRETSCGTACGQALTPWAQDIKLGALPSDDYSVQLILECSGEALTCQPAPISPLALTPTPVPACEFNGAIYNYDVRFEIVPPSPAQTGAVLRIAGVSSDSCLPRYQRYEAVPGGITVYAVETSCGAVCQTVLTPWSFEVPLDALDPGSYSVQLQLLCGDDNFQCGGAVVAFGNITRRLPLVRRRRPKPSWANWVPSSRSPTPALTTR